jgi:phage I-like protein
MERDCSRRKHHEKEHEDKSFRELFNKLRRIIMATKQEVLDAIAAEKAQVLTGIEELNVTIEDLKTQIANGTPVTAADLDEIVTAVHDIFVPVTEK